MNERSPTFPPVIPQKEVEEMKDTVAKQGVIYITEADRDRLSKLIGAMRASGSDQSQEYLDRLAEELDRGEIVTPQNLPHDVITMRSRVRLRDLDSGEVVVYALVFPNEADLGKGNISILAPIGTAMLGYRVGDTIEWDVPAGRRR